jgi:hypothetical protein
MRAVWQELTFSMRTTGSLVEPVSEAAVLAEVCHGRQNRVSCCSAMLNVRDLDT